MIQFYNFLDYLTGIKMIYPKKVFILLCFFKGDCRPYAKLSMQIIKVQVLFPVLQGLASQIGQENLRDGIWKCKTRRIILYHDVYMP